VVVVVLLAVGAMEFCFICSLVVVFFFVLTVTLCFKSSKGVFSVRVLRHSFELDLLGFAGVLVILSSLCCSTSISDHVASLSGNVEHLHSERGLHAPRV